MPELEAFLLAFELVVQTAADLQVEVVIGVVVGDVVEGVEHLFGTDGKHGFVPLERVFVIAQFARCATSTLARPTACRREFLELVEDGVGVFGVQQRQLTDVERQGLVDRRPLVVEAIRVPAVGDELLAQAEDFHAVIALAVVVDALQLAEGLVGAEHQQLFRCGADADDVAELTLYPPAHLVGQRGVIDVDVDGGRVLGQDADVAVFVAAFGEAADVEFGQVEALPGIFDRALRAVRNGDDPEAVFAQLQRSV